MAHFAFVAHFAFANRLQAVVWKPTIRRYWVRTTDSIVNLVCHAGRVGVPLSPPRSFPSLDVPFP